MVSNFMIKSPTEEEVVFLVFLGAVDTRGGGWIPPPVMEVIGVVAWWL
jgi:hypothetical protein